jgi:alpha-D-ribose 1-methylphosphonate 5-triphosphate synthase subunit PhnL
MALGKINQQTFIESIQEALDKGTHAIGLFFDLTKAYDVINHDMLLGKLHSYFHSLHLVVCQNYKIN